MVGAVNGSRFKVRIAIAEVQTCFLVVRRFFWPTLVSTVTPQCECAFRRSQRSPMNVLLCHVAWAVLLPVWVVLLFGS